MQFNYFTSIHLLIPIYEKFVCYNHYTKYTDWCSIPNDGGWGICLRMWKPVKEVALNILNNGRLNVDRHNNMIRVALSDWQIKCRINDNINVVSWDGPLLDTRMPAFTPVIDRGPAQWRSSGSHDPTAGEQDDCYMLLISAM